MIRYVCSITHREVNLMGKRSLSQIMAGFEEGFWTLIAGALNGDLLNGTETLKTGILAMCREALSEAISEIDDMVNTSIERKQSGLIVQRRGDPRTVSTCIGEITFKRTYYKRKDSNEYCYVVDYLIGAEKWERLSKELSISLIELATEMSYQKAAKHVEANVSRQSVNNRILSLKDVAADIKKEQINCDEINIYVDEDHVAAHVKDDLKKSVIVPVAVASTGMDYSTPNRPKLKNPLYLAEFGVKPDVFYDNLYSMVSRKYNLNNEPKVYIHADGGKWIQAYEYAFPNAVFVMDGFHIEQYLKRIRTYCDKDTAKEITRAVREGNLEYLKQQCQKALQKITDKADREKFIKLKRYFVNNFEAIKRRQLSGVNGSCTEAMVSHVTAERLSRNGCAWSINGLGQMAMILTLYKNGGKLKKEDICVRRKKEDEDDRRTNRESNGYEKYHKYLEEEQAEIIRAVRERVMGRMSNYVIDTTSGTQILMKLLSKIPTIA